ncbi:NAD(P)H-hydrate dehydratase [Novosphingobium sp.]|uniref:NAD(P)H-hydrate dehydratase n=1 Tax=Novosphingobium sp. TaxID=1874826 RepID=UPI00286CA5BB|nr:NAD(P)H-hydrate dehydratase [Novosphingobium sp.]
MKPDPVLTAAQMRAAEAALIAGGTSVDELMQRAGHGAAEWVWRMSGGRAVTVLCGPGNNGGDGWVIAEAIRARGGEVAVVMAAEPATDAAKNARALYRGQALLADASPRGEVLVDCLFGTGLTRPLSAAYLTLLQRLAVRHDKLVAIDLPSGIEADLGQPLNKDLPANDLTIALGAWKFAHFLMPAAAGMGTQKLVEIGIAEVPEAALAIARPQFAAPGVEAHKYTRGLLGVVVGAMPGAALLAAQAAQRAGAGYVRLHADAPLAASSELVVSTQPLAEALNDKRIAALLVGPGLGRDGAAREKLARALAEQVPMVLDADALVLLAPRLLSQHTAPLIATPHEGELRALEQAFELPGSGSKVQRAVALAQASGMVVVAKGADSVVAAPDGRLALAHRASTWLSTAGTGDVLAGTIASRLANGADRFSAACEGLWLHGEAARLCEPPFTAGQLAAKVGSAYANCL